MPRSAALLFTVLVFPALISGAPQRAANGAPFRTIRDQIVSDTEVMASASLAERVTVRGREQLVRDLRLVQRP